MAGYMREKPVRKLTLSLAVMAALLPSYVLPLGLGEIQLNSALNQELNAEIEVLSAAPEDAEQPLPVLALIDLIHYKTSNLKPFLKAIRLIYRFIPSNRYVNLS